MKWKNQFNTQADDTTVVNVEIQFDKLADLEAIIQMGLQEGFTAALENLDAYISSASIGR
jgi:PhnB protein